MVPPNKIRFTFEDPFELIFGRFVRCIPNSLAAFRQEECRLFGRMRDYPCPSRAFEKTVVRPSGRKKVSVVHSAIFLPCYGFALALTVDERHHAAIRQHGGHTEW